MTCSPLLCLCCPYSPSWLICSRSCRLPHRPRHTGHRILFLVVSSAMGSAESNSIRLDTACTMNSERELLSLIPHRVYREVKIPGTGLYDEATGPHIPIDGNFTSNPPICLKALMKRQSRSSPCLY